MVPKTFPLRKTIRLFLRSLSRLLTIDEKIIEEAKKYARNKRKSLSRIVQDYLTYIVKINKGNNSVNKNIDTKLSPTVRQLLGSIKIDKEKLENITDEKFKYLKEKYLE